MLSPARQRTIRSQMPVSVLEVLDALCEKDLTTYQHSLNVAAYAGRIAEALGLNDEQIVRAYIGGLLHDIGKLFFTDRLLSATSQLGSLEWTIVRDHPRLGYDLACTMPELAPYLDMIRYHHEHYNGAGYPRGMKGQNIPLLVRIVSVADAFDVMIAGRSYQAAKTVHATLKEMRELSAQQFCPDCLQALALLQEAPVERPRVMTALAP